MNLPRFATSEPMTPALSQRAGHCPPAVASTKAAGPPLIQLQRWYGNRHVQRMIADRHERAADSAALLAIRGGTVELAAGSPSGVPVDPGLLRAINQARSGGRSLPRLVRAPMERAFGADFSQVRVHVDAAADQVTSSLDARAFTTGHDIFFRQAAYAPWSAAGRELIAHELAHVVQQRGIGGDAVQCKVGFEFEAQWNVRDVSRAGAKERYRDAIASYESGIRTKLLDRMLDLDRSAYLPVSHPLRLSEQEKTRVDSLAADWIAGNTPTPVGEAKLASVGLVPGSRRWDEAVMPMMIRSEVGERPLYGENLGKGRSRSGLVVRGNRFDLTADASPTGGSNLEWVTDPLDSRSEVVTVLRAIIDMARYLNRRKDEPYIRSEDVTAGDGRPRRGLRIYPTGGELLFAPQITAGLRMDRLPELIDFFNQPAQHPGGYAKSELFTDTDTMTDSIRAARTAVAADRELRGLPTDELVGLLGLIGSYLRAGAAMADRSNAKTIAGALMARTDFAYNFSLLPVAVQDRVRGKGPGRLPRFVTLALAAAGMAEKDVGDRLFQQSVERGLAGSRQETTVPLTRRQWLETMMVGTDLLRSWKHLRKDERRPSRRHKDEWLAIHASLGALGNLRNLVGREDAKVGALIVEFRRMRSGDLKVGDLERVALDAFDLIDRLNTEKSLRYGQR